MRYPYSQLPSITSREVLAPMVPVTFSYSGNEFSTFALVDSGAAGAIISTVIAEALGMDWTRVTASVGFTLSGQFRSHKIEHVKAEIDGNVFSLTIHVVEGISPYHCILGQADLFQKATIMFEGFHNEFDITFRRMN